MLSSQDPENYSSFGPFGRSKVIQNLHGGSLIVTKDGQQILESYLSDPRANDPLQRAVINMCCSISKEYGDGSTSALVMVSNIIREMNRSSSKYSNARTDRILLIKAIETIYSIVEKYRHEIREIMIASSIWQLSAESKSNRDNEINDTAVFLRGFWGTILQPATNSAMASNIGDILVQILKYYYLPFFPTCTTFHHLIIQINHIHIIRRNG
jgi:TCP-1/cpn60 chaperonin family